MTGRILTGIVRFIYYVTLPFAFVSEVVRWISREFEEMDTLISAISWIVILMYIFSSFVRDSEETLMLLAAVLLFGLFPFFGIVLQLMLTFVFLGIRLILYVFTAINGLCCRYLSWVEGRNHEYESFAGNGYGFEDSNGEKYSNGYTGNERTGSAGQHRTGSAYMDPELQSAQAIFRMEGTFTAEQLRRRRRDLMKKNHPDSGGSDISAKRINAAYDILRRYTTAG